MSKRGKEAFQWALDMAKKAYPDGRWVLDESDYKFTVGLASDTLRKAVYLSHCGDNMGNKRINMNDDPDKEQKLAGILELMNAKWDPPSDENITCAESEL
jgi:hypothetical protein